MNSRFSLWRLSPSYFSLVPPNLTSEQHPDMTDSPIPHAYVSLPLLLDLRTELTPTLVSVRPAPWLMHGSGWVFVTHQTFSKDPIPPPAGAYDPFEQGTSFDKSGDFHGGTGVVMLLRYSDCPVGESLEATRGTWTLTSCLCRILRRAHLLPRLLLLQRGRSAGRRGQGRVGNVGHSDLRLFCCFHRQRPQELGRSE